MTAASEQELLAQIAEAPDDDGPRLALADFYADRGDPRGELMSIQLATHPLHRHNKKRIARLLQELGPTMVGTLAEYLDHESLRFERGRLHACRTLFRHGDQRTAALGSPYWATVVELETDDPDLAADPAMRSLRILCLSSLAAFAALCRTPRPLAIETVEVYWRQLVVGTLDDRAAIAHTQALPRVRRLILQLGAAEPITAQRLHWLIASPLGQQLDELLIESTARVDRASFDELRRSWPRPAQIEFVAKVGSRTSRYRFGDSGDQ